MDTFDDSNYEDHVILKRIGQNDPLVAEWKVNLKHRRRDILTSIDWAVQDQCSACHGTISGKRSPRAERQRNFYNIYTHGCCIGCNIYLKTLSICWEDDITRFPDPWDLYWRYTSGKGKAFEFFISALSGNRSIEDLTISIIDASVFGHLSPFIKHNASLRRLTIDYQTNMNPKGNRLLAAALATRDNESSLKEVVLRGVKIDNKETVEIFDALSECDHGPFKFTLSRSKADWFGFRTEQQNPSGWFAIANMIQVENCRLKEVNISSCDVGDQGAEYLGAALSLNNTITKLTFDGNENITRAGMQSFLTFLHGPQSVLEEANLSNCSIDDRMVALVANSLRYNKSLKKLNLRFNSITDLGWMSFAPLLCNKSSINDTYKSNHTLETLDTYGSGLRPPGGISLYLQTNQNANKSEVARQKILRTHFRGFTSNINLQPFIDMDPTLLPHAIAWLGRVDDSAHTLLYKLIPCMSDLFHMIAKFGRQGGELK